MSIVPLYIFFLLSILRQSSLHADQMSTLKLTKVSPFFFKLLYNDLRDSLDDDDDDIWLLLSETGYYIIFLIIYIFGIVSNWSRCQFDVCVCVWVIVVRSNYQDISRVSREHKKRAWLYLALFFVVVCLWWVTRSLIQKGLLITHITHTFNLFYVVRIEALAQLETKHRIERARAHVSYVTSCSPNRVFRNHALLYMKNEFQEELDSRAANGSSANSIEIKI